MKKLCKQIILSVLLIPPVIGVIIGTIMLIETVGEMGREIREVVKGEIR
jgi:hypothetical protein